MTIEIIIPRELEAILEELKRKDTKRNLLKVYAALIHISKGKAKMRCHIHSSFEFFNVPSSYLKKVNSRYNNYLKILLENKIIIYYSKNIDILYNGGLFDDDIVHIRKYYNTEMKECAKYAFTIDTRQGKKIELEMKNPNETKPWFILTKKSLETLGLNGKIKRDSHSQRLHTKITGNLYFKDNLNKESDSITSYKIFFKKYYKDQFTIIDAVACQPSIMNFFLIENNIKDENFSYAFDKQIDFYQNLVNQNVFKNRTEAKHQYMLWQNGEKYNCNSEIRKFFKQATSFIDKLKKVQNYKYVNQIITRMESKVFIDDLLSNIDLDFCLTVHDSLIVRNNNAEFALQYCQKKYGQQFQFKTEKL